VAMLPKDRVGFRQTRNQRIGLSVLRISGDQAIVSNPAGVAARASRQCGAPAIRPTKKKSSLGRTDWGTLAAYMVARKLQVRVWKPVI